MTFRFWYRWLLVVSVASTVLGIMIALLADTVLFAPYTSAMETVFFDGAMSESTNEMRTFLFAPLGATIAGYFLLQTMIVWGPFRRREPWAWHAVFWALLIWFVPDSLLSIYHGAFFNVWMVNLWTLFLVGLPLLMTRRAFTESSPHTSGKSNLNEQKAG